MSNRDSSDVAAFLTDRAAKDPDKEMSATLVRMLDETFGGPTGERWVIDCHYPSLIRTPTYSSFSGPDFLQQLLSQS
jgi:hypothetical protein